MFIIPIPRYLSLLTYKLPITDVYPLSQAFYKLEAGKNKLLKDLESNIIQGGCAIHFKNGPCRVLSLRILIVINSALWKEVHLQQGTEAAEDTPCSLAVLRSQLH